MAKEPGDEDDTLELTPEMEADDTDQDAEHQDGDDEDGEGGEEETVIGFADEGGDDGEGKPDDNATIRTMRQQLKESKARIRELEQTTPAATKIEVGEKPTLAGCNYDEEAYETAVDEWRDRKTQADNAETQAAEQNRAANEAWQTDVAAYNNRKANLGVTDFAEAEDTVSASLSNVQQAVIVKAADDPAAFIYALSKSGTKLAELAKIQDPIKLAAAIARMEGAVKVVKKRKGPAIDKPQQGSGKTPVSGDIQKKLEALEAKSGGDRTEVIAFKKKHGLL